MNEIERLGKYRRFLKRRNYSTHMIKNDMNMLQHFVWWLQGPIEEVAPKECSAYIDSFASTLLKLCLLNFF